VKNHVMRRVIHTPTEKCVCGKVSSNLSTRMPHS
jgi:hypothetical protein